MNEPAKIECKLLTIFKEYLSLPEVKIKISFRFCQIRFCLDVSQSG